MVPNSIQQATNLKYNIKIINTKVDGIRGLQGKKDLPPLPELGPLDSLERPRYRTEAPTTFQLDNYHQGAPTADVPKPDQGGPKQDCHQSKCLDCQVRVSQHHSHQTDQANSNQRATGKSKTP